MWSARLWNVEFTVYSKIVLSPKYRTYVFKTFMALRILKNIRLNKTKPHPPACHY